MKPWIALAGIALTVTVLLGFTMLGCGGGGGGGDGAPDLSAEQRAQIEQTSQAVTDSLTGAAQPGSAAALEAARRLAAGRSNVESAEIIDGDLVVQYRNAGQEVWVQGNALPTPPADLAELQALTRSVLAQAVRPAANVGTRKAVLVNALAADPGFADAAQVFADMESVLEAVGFDVLMLAGADASPERLRQLADRSVIVYLGHGGNVKWWEGSGDAAWGWPYATQTGRLWDGQGSLSDWMLNRIVKMNVGWGRTSEERSRNRRSFYAVTGRFWEHAYSGSHFANALFINCACSGAKYEEFRRHLFDVGVGAYTGWTETQGIAPYTAWRMLALMASGRNLQQAYDALPSAYRTETSDGVTANLWIGPDSGKSITLGGTSPSHPEIVIWAPQMNETITGRECTVRGRIEPWSSGLSTTIAVNGQSSHLPVDWQGIFAQPVGLRSGTNLIRVSVIGASEHSAEVRVNGSFSSDVLYTALWWNTNDNDIDLHLVPVEGAGGWRDDCYFGHMTTSWGATLDVDDVNGFGPEHITARTILPGKYKLYVHYWSTHGQSSPTVVNVAVSTNGGQSRVFTLPAMRQAGDLWEVCYVTFPSGAIQVIDRFTPVSGYSMSARHLYGGQVKAGDLDGVLADPSLRRYQPAVQSGR